MSKNKNKRLKRKAEQEHKKLHNKLIRVISNAGLAYSSWISLVEMVDKIPGFDTAAWVYNDKTKKEHIWFSKRLLKSLTVDLLKLVLRHEMLHKSMYRGMWKVGNMQLLNFALDACINKILWLSEPKGMCRIGNFMFPDAETRPNVLSIMNASITTDERNKMEPRIQAIYDKIWWCPMKGFENGIPIDTGKTCHDYWMDQGTFANDYIPDALNLYNAMAAMLSPADKEEIAKQYEFMNCNNKDKKDKPDKGGKHVRGGRFKLRATDKKTIKDEKAAADAVISDIKKQGEKQQKQSGRGGGFSTLENMQDYFSQHVYDKSSSDTRDIKDFIKRMETWKQVEGCTANIYKNFRSRTKIDPYPFRLTRTGFELVALGFTDEIPIYLNKVYADEGGKKKVCCYFDTSPSMNSFIPYVVWMADYFDQAEECEIAGGKFQGKYGFSGKVKGIPAAAWEDFKNGRVRGGCSTSFESVIKHACERVENDDVDVILVFTDGESGLSQETIDRFNASGKKCYSIYFAHQYGYKHERCGQSADAQMTSDLDSLNGDSFTIWCSEEEMAAAS